MFAGYRIEHLVGKGGMAEVYLARDRNLPRSIALKVLSPLARLDDDLKKRFRRETEAVAALSHPNIVTIHDGGTNEKVPWISMAYIDGGDLRSQLLSGHLGAVRSVALISDIAEALDHAHEHGIVHRDVKPANILITSGRNERAILTDFGIAKSGKETSHLTQTANMVGSFQYAAPERFAATRELDPRSDVYSLGCTLYHLLTGMPPYAGDIVQLIAAHAHAPIPSLSESNLIAPNELDSVIIRALAKNPEDRFETCFELAEAARAALTGTTVTALTAKDIRGFWPEIRMSLKAEHASLHAMLSGSRFSHLDKNVLVLVHQNAPLMTRLSSEHNRGILLGAIHEVLGSNLYDLRWELA
ncbi:serine/threonine-protein kinase [Nocardia asteroides]|uniref:serine/threonine-protein kinase n=1 Tax=Nocardia asteroides TaxID=1824 RepID=UPI0022B8309D|nr:protein kinase [Nocardia asteroides]